MSYVVGPGDLVLVSMLCRTTSRENLCLCRRRYLSRLGGDGICLSVRTF